MMIPQPDDVWVRPQRPRYRVEARFVLRQRQALSDYVVAAFIRGIHSLEKLPPGPKLTRRVWR